MKKPTLESAGLHITEEEWNAICIGKTCHLDYNGTKCPIVKSCMETIRDFNSKPLVADNPIKEPGQ